MATPNMMPRTPTAERMQTLSYILSEGLSYSWFKVSDLDDEAVTATVWTDEDEEETFEIRHEITADDVARGLRMVREYFNGERELYHGQWRYYLDKDPNWKPPKGSKDGYLRVSVWEEEDALWSENASKAWDLVYNNESE